MGIRAATAGAAFLRNLLLILVPTLANAAEPPASAPTPPPGWRLELVASAPTVRHPSVVACAPDGRVFVAEDPMDIARPANVAEGRILCRHPDGRFTVFAERLHAVFGMQYLEGRLYVLHNPYFSVFDDDNGTGRNRTELVEQTNPNPWALDWNDHVPANFKLAMDGFFYVAVGDKGLFGARGRDGRQVDLHGGGIVRIRPDGTGLEVFSTGVRNILDVGITSEDDLFTYDNTDENHWMGRVTHMVDGGFYGYPFDFIPRRPYTLWMMADYGAGAATGVECYTGDALPAEYRDNLFLADFGQRNIRRVVLQRDGATFRPASDSQLFANPPGDFRPVGIAFDDAGTSLWICDWQHRDTKEDAVAGRLWRLTWNGPSHAKPRPNWYTNLALGRTGPVPRNELGDALHHPARSVRLTAQRALARTGSNQFIQRKDLLEAGDSLAGVHAIWALHALGGEAPEPGLIASAARSRNPVIARQALRHIGESGTAALAPVVRSRLTQPDASVRFHAATALGRLADTDSVPHLLAALDDRDRFTRHAVFTALNRIGRARPFAWSGMIQAFGHASDPVREGVRFAFRDTFDPWLVRELSNAATNRTLPPSIRTNALGALASLHHQPRPWNGEWWAYHPFRLQPPPRTNSWEGTAPALAALTAGLEDEEPQARIVAADALRTVPAPIAGPPLLGRFDREQDPDVRAALLRALAQVRPGGTDALAIRLLKTAPPDQPLGPETVALALANPTPAVHAAVLNAAQDRATSDHGPEAFSLLADVAPPGSAAWLAVVAADAGHPHRIHAIAALGRVGGRDAIPELARHLDGGGASGRLAAVRALAALREPGAVPHLVGALADPALREEAVRGLLLVPDPRATAAYLDALGSKQASLRADARRALARVRDTALPAVMAAARQLPPAVVGDLQQIYRGHEPARTAGLFNLESVAPDRDAYLAFGLANPGDTERGKKLFNDTAGVACIACHRVQGQGGGVGPDLSGAGAQFDRRTLAESILWPSRAVREGYNVVELDLDDGETVSGMIRAESGDSISLQPATGDPVNVPKSRVRQRRQTPQSLMPEGLEAGLSPEDFADLLAYLQSLRSGT